MTFTPDQMFKVYQALTKADDNQLMQFASVLGGLQLPVPQGTGAAQGPQAPELLKTLAPAPAPALPSTPGVPVPLGLEQILGGYRNA